MTELTGPDAAAAQPFPDWPEAGGAGITDPAVARALARLADLPHAPVAEHEAAYTALHDELLEALNDEHPGARATDGAA
jgi:hypothetical protein